MNTEKDLEYLIREGIIQSQADLDDYFKMYSTKVTRKGKSTAARTREYAIKFEDLKAQILGNVCDITMTPLIPPASDLGSLVAFSKADYATPPTSVDIVSPFVQLRRGNSQGLFNHLTEPSYQTNVSPAGTQWLSIHTDATFSLVTFNDPSHYTWADWATAMNFNPSQAVVDGLILIMHDIQANDYWAFQFTQWTQNNAGGGLVYKRIRITPGTAPCELTFSDGTVQTTAAPDVDVTSSNGSILYTKTESPGNISFDLTVNPAMAGGAIGYSNVYFVDTVQGNDGTAQAGRFDKPYANVATAINAASIAGPSSTSRALVYIRKGYYTGWKISLQNHVDIYCEDGTVFAGYWGWVDNGSAVNCNIRGKAIYQETTSNVLYITGASNINFEFNYIYASSNAPIFIQSPVQSTINIEGDSIYATTVGAGYAITFRENCDVTMNIRKWINCSHGCIDIRSSFSGKLVINCPKIILNATNYYGGNYKQGIIVYSATSTSSIIINGDFINEMPDFLAGISGMITFWGAAECYLEFNGKIYAGKTYGLYAHGDSINSRLVVNGSIESDVQPIWISSYTNCYVRNGVIVKNSTDVGASVILYAFAKLFMNNCFIYNAEVDGDCINVIDSTNDINLYNVVGQSEGLAGNGITSANPVNVRVHDSRFNKDKSVNITDLLSPTGYVFDTNVIVPKY